MNTLLFFVNRIHEIQNDSRGSILSTTIQQDIFDSKEANISDWLDNIVKSIDHLDGWV